MSLKNDPFFELVKGSSIFKRLGNSGPPPQQLWASKSSTVEGHRKALRIVWNPGVLGWVHWVVVCCAGRAMCVCVVLFGGDKTVSSSAWHTDFTTPNITCAWPYQPSTHSCSQTHAPMHMLTHMHACTHAHNCQSGTDTEKHIPRNESQQFKGKMEWNTQKTLLWQPCIPLI